MRKLILIIILLGFKVSLNAQTGAPRLRADTVKSFTSASFVYLNDSLRISSFIQADSTGFPIAPSFGSSRLVFRGDSGIYYWDGNSRVRLDTTYASLGKITRVLESDGNPSIANVDSLEFNSTNFSLTNPSGSRVAVNTIQDIATTSSPTFTNVNVNGYVGVATGGKIDFSGGNFVWDGTFSAGTAVQIQNFDGINSNSLLSVDNGNTVRSINHVALGQVLTSQGTTTAPAWSASPSLTGLTLSTPLSISSGGTGSSIFQKYGVIFFDSTRTKLKNDSDNFAWSELTKRLLVGKGLTGVGRVSISGNSDGYILNLGDTNNVPVQRWYINDSLTENVQFLFPRIDSGRSSIEWKSTLPGNPDIITPYSIEVHGTKDASDSTHQHVTHYLWTPADSILHVWNMQWGSYWNNHVAHNSSVLVKDSLLVGNFAADDVYGNPIKRFTLSGSATKTFGLDANTSTNALETYNDVPALIGSIDSAGNQKNLGYMYVGSVGTPSNTTAGDLSTTRLSVGNTAFPFSSTIYSNPVYTTTSGNLFPFTFQDTIRATSKSTAAYRSFHNEQVISASSDTLSSSVYAGYFYNRWLSAKSATQLTGFLTGGFIGSTSTNFETITNVTGLEAYGVFHFTNNPTGTITTANSILARNQTRGGTNLSITNSRGVSIETQTLGTNNTNLLIGTGTTGNWSIYNGSTYTNFRAAVDSGTTTWRGSNSFTTTATEDTVTITGASVNDFYWIQLTGTTAPSANDAIRVEATATGFIVHRSASGTSGLTYNWLRIK